MRLGWRRLAFAVELAVVAAVFTVSWPEATEAVDVRRYHLLPGLLALVALIAVEAAVLATLVPLVDLSRAWAKALVGGTFLAVFIAAVGAVALVNRMDAGAPTHFTGTLDHFGSGRNTTRFGQLVSADGERLDVPRVVLERHHLRLGDPVTVRLRPGLVFDAGWIVVGQAIEAVP